MCVLQSRTWNLKMNLLKAFFFKISEPDVGFYSTYRCCLFQNNDRKLISIRKQAVKAENKSKPKVFLFCAELSLRVLLNQWSL